MNETERKRIASLIAQRINGRLNRLEKRELKAWARKSTGNRRLLDDMSDQRILMRELLEYDLVDGAAIWSDMVRNIPVLQTLPEEEPAAVVPLTMVERRSQYFHRWLVAALLIIIVGSAVCYPFLHNYLSQQKKQTQKEESHIPGRGGTMRGDYLKPGGYKLRVTRPDGVSLDAANIPDTAVKIFDKLSMYRRGEGILIYQSQGRSREKPSNNLLTTPRGGWYLIILPDSSKVYLNDTSSLSFSTNFGWGERTINLRGEAYFEVSHHFYSHRREALPPFVVKVRHGTGVLKLSAAEAWFNVTAYPDDAHVKVTVLKGTLHVEDSAATAMQFLKPGELYLHDTDGKAGLVYDNVDTTEIVAWKNNYFLFDHKPLTDIMQQLARWYDATLIYRDTPQISFITSGVRTDSIQALLKSMEKTNQVHFTLDKSHIFITR